MLFYTPKNGHYEKDKVIFDRLVQVLNGTAKGNHVDFSWPLPNMKQTTESNFWSHRAHYTPSVYAYMGRSQIKNVYGKLTWATVLIYLVDEVTLPCGGYCVTIDDKNVVTYYTFQLCVHEYKQTNLGNCYNRYTCVKCGGSYEVDSSG